MSEQELISIINNALKRLYKEDEGLIKKDLCERCLVHRLAFYLQVSFPTYFVDCEFNKSFYEDTVHKKILSNINGNYVDIIVQRRSNNYGENLLCLEIKKSSNKRDRDKDRENLTILTATDRFVYLLGFYVILGKTYQDTKIELYHNGNFIREVNVIQE